MDKLRQYPIRFLHALLDSGQEIDYLDGLSARDLLGVANSTQNARLGREVRDLKDQGYHVVGYFNSIPLCIREGLENTPDVDYKILNHYCWITVNEDPLRSDVVLVRDEAHAVYLKLIAADEPQFLGVHKK